MIFTDGSNEDELHTICGVSIFEGGSQCFECYVPSALTKKLESSKHIIGMVELYGALVARTVGFTAGESQICSLCR